MSQLSDKEWADQLTIDELRQLPLTHQATIPESYLDMMGHMNVMWYTHLFGQGIGSLIKLLGMTRDFCIDNQIGTFALKQYISYWNEVRAGENISVRTRLLGRSAKRLHLMHFMIKDDHQRLAATSEVLVIHIDMRIRRSVPFLPSTAESIDRLVDEHAAISWKPPLARPIQA